MASGSLGSLHIDFSDVQQQLVNINGKFEEFLKNLSSSGNTIHIDMTPFENMKKELDVLKTKIDDVNSKLKNLGSDSGGGRSESSGINKEKQALNELIKLYVELEKVQQQMVRSRGANDAINLTKDYERLTAQIAKYSAALQKSAQENTRVQQAQRKTNDVIAKEWDRMEQQQAAQAAKEEARVQKRIELEQRKAEAIAHTQKQAELQNTFNTQLSPEEQKIQKLVDLYLQLEQVKMKMYQGQDDPAKLAQQYNDLTQVISRYTDAHREEAQANEQVVASRQKTLDLVTKLVAEEEKRAAA